MSLRKTYSEGYAVEIRNGEIFGVLPNGAPYLIPHTNPKWRLIATEIAELVNAECFTYSHHSTKPRPERKDDQLTLIFDQFGSLASAVVFFNVDTSYQRNTRHHEAGTQRPQGEFTTPPNGSLVKLFRVLGLTPTKRLSQFNRALPQLRRRIFTGTLASSAGIRKLDKESLVLLSLSTDDLRELFNAKNRATTDHLHPKNSPINGQNVTNRADQENPATPYTTSDSEQFKYKQDLVQTTSNQQQTTNKAPQDQSNKEWLEDFSN